MSDYGPAITIFSFSTFRTRENTERIDEIKIAKIFFEVASDKATKSYVFVNKQKQWLSTVAIRGWFQFFDAKRRNRTKQSIYEHVIYT